VTPGRMGAVVTVEIPFVDQSLPTKVVVLLGAWNRRQHIEGGDVRIQLPENTEVLLDRILCILGKTQNIREVRHDALLAALLNDLAVDRGVILRLLGREQGFSVKGFHSHKHLKTPSPSQEFDQTILLVHLGIALHKKGQIKVLRDHRAQQFFGVGIFVEVVGGEHYKLDSALFCQVQALDNGVNRHAANLASGYFYHRAEIAGEGAAARRIEAEHRNNVTFQFRACRRRDHGACEFGLPSSGAAVYRFQLSSGCVLQDLIPYHFRFGKGEAYASTLQGRGVAGHRMRAANYAMLDAAFSRKSGQVEAALKLV